jgi:hypothetical protein
MAGPAEATTTPTKVEVKEVAARRVAQWLRSTVDEFIM